MGKRIFKRGSTSLKVTGVKNGFVEVEGLGIRFAQDEAEVDLAGEYFTADTFLGHNKGDGVPAMFQHGRNVVPPDSPTAARNFGAGLSKHAFKSPVTTRLAEDGSGLVAGVLLDMRSDYEKFVAELVSDGVLFWSSGSTPHMVEIDEGSGEIKQWPIAEFSFTPTPAEPRLNKMVQKALKSLSIGYAQNTEHASGLLIQAEILKLIT